MTRSELKAQLAARHPDLPPASVAACVATILGAMSSRLANGDRVEIRGFGSFSVHYREPRTGRNPKSGEAVPVLGKYSAHFKPGQELRARVNIFARDIQDVQ